MTDRIKFSCHLTAETAGSACAARKVIAFRGHFSCYISQLYFFQVISPRLLCVRDFRIKLNAFQVWFREFDDEQKNIVLQELMVITV